MIKRIILGLFAVLVPVCIICYIAGGIFNIIFGEYRPHYEYNDSELDSVKQWTVTDTSKAYSFNIDAMKNLTFKLSGIKADIVLSDRDDIQVSVKNDNTERDIQVTLSNTNYTSTVEIHPSNITFNLNPGGLMSWLDDIFGDNPKCSVEIYVPARIYEKLEIKQGSGNTKVTNVNARFNNIEIGSGSFELVKDHRFAANEINVSLGSGSAKLYNLDTEVYSFKIGSGSFEASGIKGDGNADIGSGSVTLSYAEFNRLSLIKGSGTLNMLLPPSTATNINAKLGSGLINIDTDNKNDIIKASGDYFIGTDETQNMLNINNGSGNIYIKNNDGDDYVEVPPVSEGLKDNDTDSSSEYEQSSSSVDSSFGSADSIDYVTEDTADSEENSRNAFSSSSSSSLDSELEMQLIYQAAVTDGRFQ